MLELEHAGFRYGRHDGTPWVFRDLSIRLTAGTATAVLGPNGSGKTTLIRCAAGLLSPSEGKVHCAGAAGYVPQARGSSFAYRALDMVLMGRTRQVGIFRSPGRADYNAAARAMEDVGIIDLAERLFPTLSGGEQQLVLIARAVAAGSDVLILDEPATALDLKNQVRVLNLLREMVSGGMALLLSTHHPDHALDLADDVVLMDAEGIRAGDRSNMLTGAALSRLYGLPVGVLDYTDGAGIPRRTVVTHSTGSRLPLSAEQL